MSARLPMLVLLLLELTCGYAREAPSVASDPVLEERVQRLSAELRCLVCQNQSLADSHADLAIDLRNQVRDQMKAGRSDDEIKSWLTQRYGDFVLYRPPVKASTWLLWGGPFVLLALGTIGMIAYLRARHAKTTSTSLSVEDHARVDALLGAGAPPTDAP
ncbi:MAG: cytochrome c-type biogenesis protein [Betaproteobacteria bacterium]